MASVIEKLPTLDSFRRPPFPVRRWTVEEYRRMTEIGVLTEDDRVELLEGWIVPKMTHHPPHAWTVTEVTREIMAILSHDWVLRTQCSIVTLDSEPEPDVAVVNGPSSRYLSQHPGAGDVELVIEVAESSLRKDRRKAAIYAGAEIPSYWIINLNDRQIEVHASPDVAQRRYRDVRILQAGDRVPLMLAGQAIADYSVEQLLPPAESHSTLESRHSTLP